MKQQVIMLLAAAWLIALSGCHYYEEYRVLKSTADIQDEKAELLRAYRLCLSKYQDDSFKAKDLCAPYTQSLREIEVKHQGPRYDLTKGEAVTHKRYLLLLGAAFLGGLVGGVVSDQLFSHPSAQAQNTKGMNAEEFLLLDSTGKARAGLGLDANGEVGFVLRSKDGMRTLTLSPDDRSAIKLVERGGRVLWGAP